VLEENPWPPELAETVLAFRRVIVPPSRPVNAAVSTNELLETFMFLYTPSFVGYSRIPQISESLAKRLFKRNRPGSIRVYDSPVRCGFERRGMRDKKVVKIRKNGRASLL
jgi:hypothetical protein